MGSISHRVPNGRATELKGLCRKPEPEEASNQNLKAVRGKQKASVPVVQADWHQIDFNQARERQDRSIKHKQQHLTTTKKPSIVQRTNTFWSTIQHENSKPPWRFLKSFYLEHNVLRRFRWILSNRFCGVDITRCIRSSLLFCISMHVIHCMSDTIILLRLSMVRILHDRIFRWSYRSEALQTRRRRPSQCFNHKHCP